jgi:hypothetical protein
MAEPKSFLLRYVGARFEGTRLPLDVLGDLPAFRDLLVSYAAAEWRKAHTDRERLPKNFEKGLLFDLVDIEDGSAMPRIEWDRRVPQPQLPDMMDEMEMLVSTSFDRVISLFDHATGPAAALDLTPDNIRALKRFGGNLLPDEKIEFPGSKGSDGNVVYLDKHRRERLITSVRDSYQIRYDGTGKLIGSGVDPSGTNGHIDVHTEEYGTITLPVTPDRVRSDFDGSIESEVYFRLHIELDNNEAVRSIVYVFDVDVIPSHVMASLSACRNRIGSLTSLRDGWHDGGGRAPTAKAASAASRLLSRKPGMADSYSIFPTDGGGVLFEFVRLGWNHSIEIGPAGKAEIYSTEIDGDGEADTEAFDVESEEFIEEFDQVTGTRI